MKRRNDLGWKFSTLAAFAILVLSPLSGCKDGNTVMGSTSIHDVTPTPTPAAAGLISNWDVGFRVISVAGPDFCIYTPGVGGIFHKDYSVRRNGAFAISFIPDGTDFIDWSSYTGTIEGAGFSASNGPMDSGPDMCTHYVQASTLAGSFSADGNHFTAAEIWSYTLDSGQVKTVTLQWVGYRQ